MTDNYDITRAATLDARRNLIERLHGLRLTSSTLVRDFITERDEINAQLQSVIAGSAVENRRVEADLATVTISVSGPDVWTIVHSQLRIESRRHGPADGLNAPAALGL